MILTKTLLLIVCLFLPLSLFAGETPSPEGAKAYFIDLHDGDNVKSPLLIRFGLTEQMGIAPAHLQTGLIQDIFI